MTDLPNWVYDVVIELQRWSDTHPKLLAETYPDYTPKPYPECGCAALDLVPKDVRAQAKVIKFYLDASRPAESDSEPLASGDTDNARTSLGGDPGAAT